MQPLANIQLTLRPGIIDLGWGHPAPDLLPVAALADAAASALATYGSDTLAYGPERGNGALVQWLCDYISRSEGRAIQPGEILLTGGNSQALDQVCTLCTRPGDVVLVEAPTYHLALRILRDHPLDLRPIPLDAGGLRLDLLADTLASLRRAGRAARLLYSVPTFNNPTGLSLSLAQRQALVDLAAREGVLIVEDDVYRELAYDEAAPPSLWSLAAPGVVVRLGSFAKSVAPGLRLGWLTADAALVQRFVGSGLLDSGGAVNHFTAMVVAALCSGGGFERQVVQLRAAYRARRDALLAGLAAHMPAGCQWQVPAGGFFVWLRLPAGADAAALLPHAEAAGVAFLPGVRFDATGASGNCLRLAFSLYPPAELYEATRRLGTVLP